MLNSCTLSLKIVYYNSMKQKILLAIPTVFSLRSSDYSSFVVHDGASQMMRDAWAGIGRRLRTSMDKVVYVETEQSSKNKNKIWPTVGQENAKRTKHP